MGHNRSEEFCKYAIRIVSTNSLTRPQIVDDLGIGMSVLNKWITTRRDAELAKIGSILNNQPREWLGSEAPHDVFAKSINTVAHCA